MLIVETITKVRLAYFKDGKAIREIARKFNLARNTVKNIIRSGVTDQKYERNEQPRPKLGSFIKIISELLKEDSGTVRHRKSAQILFEQLHHEGYEGGYDTEGCSWEISRFCMMIMVNYLPSSGLTNHR